MNKLVDIFPLLFQHFEPLLFFINTIDADNIGAWINNVINLLSNVDFNELHSIPMMLMSWFGLPFDDEPHRAHGSYHMPPPFWFGNKLNPFDSFMPPAACPFGFNGFNRHGYGHRRFHRHGHRQQGNSFGCSNSSNSMGPMFGGNGCHGKRKWCGKNDENNSSRSCRGKWNKRNENGDYSVEIINDEVTLMDKAFVLSGQSIIKTWHIKNNGKKDWSQDIKLKYYGKAFNPIINGVEFNVPNLKINEEGDVSVIIETPKDFIGKQKANFRLVLNNTNKPFGPVFRVRVIVVNNHDGESPVQLKEKDVEDEKKRK